MNASFQEFKLHRQILFCEDSMEVPSTKRLLELIPTGYMTCL